MEISVFKHVKRTLSSSERVILFNILEQSSGLPHYHFTAFNESYIDDNLITKSKIVPVLIKQLLPYIRSVSRDKKHGIPIQLDNVIANIPAKEQFFISGLQFRTQKKKVVSFVFRDEKDAIEKLHQMIDYINFKKSYTPLPKTILEVYETSEKTKRKYVFNEDIKHIDDVYTNKLGPIISNNLQLTLSNALDIIYGRLWLAYCNTIIKGPKHPDTLSLLEDETHIQDRNKMIKRHENMFNNIKHIQHAKDAIGYEMFNKYKLSEKEQKIIDLVYVSKKKNDILSMNNKCKHLGLVRRFLSGQEVDELKDIMDRSKSDVITCKLCKFNILCPHYFDGGDLIKNYTDGIPINNSYFCKYCGESVVTIFAEDNIAFDGVSMYDIEQSPFKDMVWKNVRMNITSHMDVSKITNPNTLVNSISSLIYDHIHGEYIRQSSIKTNTIDNINNIMYLFISIYTIAAMMKLAPHKKYSISFKKHAYKTRNHLFRFCLELLTNTKQNLVDKISNITADSIPPIFAKAYKALDIDGISTDYVVKAQEPMYIVGGVVYQYLYYAHKKHKSSLKYTNIKHILGVELQDVPSLKHITEHATMPDDWATVGATGATGATGVDQSYAYCSFKHFMSYVNNKLYTLPTIKNPQHEEHRSDFLKLQESYRKISTQTQKRFNIRNNISYKKDHGVFIYQKIPWSYIYCEDGRKHKFNIYIYEDKTEISPSTVNKWILGVDKNKQLIQKKIVDVKCSVCKSVWSKLGPGTKIPLTIIENDKIADFYTFYTFKCIVEGIHTFENDVCTKCGITPQFIQSRDKSFYSKHKFVKEKQNIVFTKHSKKPVIKYPKWKALNEPMSQIASILHLPSSALNNIGRPTGAGAETTMAHILCLNTYVNMVIIEYELLRNGTKLAPGLSSFKKEWNINFSKFPDISFEHRKYENLDIQYNYTLYTFSDFLRGVYSSFKENSPEYKAGVAVVRYFIDKILTTEKLIGTVAIMEDTNDDIVDVESAKMASATAGEVFEPDIDEFAMNNNL